MPSTRQSMVIQTLIFSKELFTESEAKAWAKDNKFDISDVRETENSFRVRQEDPDDFDKDSFRTIKIKPGVSAVIGRTGKSKQSRLLVDGGMSLKVGDKFDLRKWAKDVIRIGRYVHPKGKWELDVTNERMDKWVKAFAEMQKVGIRIPTPVDHSDDSARNLGWVNRVWRKGDTLWCEMEIDHPDGNLSNSIGRTIKEVSVSIAPRFIDGTGKDWGEAIEHISPCTHPIVAGQGEFQSIAARRVEADEGEVHSAPATKESRPKIKLTLRAELEKHYQFAVDSAETLINKFLGGDGEPTMESIEGFLSKEGLGKGSGNAGIKLAFLSKLALLFPEIDEAISKYIAEKVFVEKETTTQEGAEDGEDKSSSMSFILPLIGIGVSGVLLPAVGKGLAFIVGGLAEKVGIKQVGSDEFEIGPFTDKSDMLDAIDKAKKAGFAVTYRYNDRFIVQHLPFTPTTTYKPKVAGESDSGIAIEQAARLSSNRADFAILPPFGPSWWPILVGGAAGLGVGVASLAVGKIIKKWLTKLLTRGNIKYKSVDYSRGLPRVTGMSNEDASKLIGLIKAGYGSARVVGPGVVEVGPPTRQSGFQEGGYPQYPRGPGGFSSRQSTIDLQVLAGAGGAALPIANVAGGKAGATLDPPSVKRVKDALKEIYKYLEPKKRWKGLLPKRKYSAKQAEDRLKDYLAKEVGKLEAREAFAFIMGIRRHLPVRFYTQIDPILSDLQSITRSWIRKAGGEVRRSVKRVSPGRIVNMCPDGTWRIGSGPCAYGSEREAMLAAEEEIVTTMSRDLDCLIDNVNLASIDDLEWAELKSSLGRPFKPNVENKPKDVPLGEYLAERLESYMDETLVGPEDVEPIVKDLIGKYPDAASLLNIWFKVVKSVYGMRVANRESVRLARGFNPKLVEKPKDMPIGKYLANQLDEFVLKYTPSEYEVRHLVAGLIRRYPDAKDDIEGWIKQTGIAQLRSFNREPIQLGLWDWIKRRRKYGGGRGAVEPVVPPMEEKTSYERYQPENLVNRDVFVRFVAVGGRVGTVDDPRYEWSQGEFYSRAKKSVEDAGIAVTRGGGGKAVSSLDAIQRQADSYFIRPNFHTFTFNGVASKGTDEQLEELLKATLEMNEIAAIPETITVWSLQPGAESPMPEIGSFRAKVLLSDQDGGKQLSAARSIKTALESTRLSGVVVEQSRCDLVEVQFRSSSSNIEQLEDEIISVMESAKVNVDDVVVDLLREG